MTLVESKALTPGSRVIWRTDRSDAGSVTTTDWSSVTIRWDNNKSQQKFMRNDMAEISTIV